MKDAESVRNQQQQHLQQHSCTLDECFKLYTKEEQVSKRNTISFCSYTVIAQHLHWRSHLPEFHETSVI